MTRRIQSQDTHLLCLVAVASTFPSYPTKKEGQRSAVFMCILFYKTRILQAAAILNSRQQEGQAKVQELPLVIPVSSTDS